MKLPRLITRRWVKWAGVVAAAVIVAVYVCSLWLTFFYLRSTSKGDLWIAVISGRVGYTWLATPDSEGTKRSGFEIFSQEGPRASLWFDWGARRAWMPHDASLIIPLWLPLLLIAAPTAHLWYTDRRAKPWQCPKCRYDLRGLDGGVCPECGEASNEDC